MRQQNHWTDEERDIVRKGYGQGRPVQEIADELGRSRNSVIGQARRLGIQDSGNNPTKPGNNPARTGSPKPRRRAAAPHVRPEPTPEEPPIDNAHPVGQIGCKWPIGDGREKQCGADKVFGYPYCLFHCTKAYVGSDHKPRPPEHFLKRAEKAKLEAQG